MSGGGFKSKVKAVFGRKDQKIKKRFGDRDEGETSYQNNIFKITDKSHNPENLKTNKIIMIDQENVITIEDITQIMDPRVQSCRNAIEKSLVDLSNSVTKVHKGYSMVAATDCSSCGRTRLSVMNEVLMAVQTCKGKIDKTLADLADKIECDEQDGGKGMIGNSFISNWNIGQRDIMELSNFGEAEITASAQGNEIILNSPVKEEEGSDVLRGSDDEDDDDDDDDDDGDDEDGMDYDINEYEGVNSSPDSNQLVGEDGLLDVYRLQLIMDSRTRQLNQGLDQSRYDKQTIQRLCSQIDQLKKEVDMVRSSSEMSNEVIKTLTQEASSQRSILTAACDVREGCAKEAQLQRLESKCHKRYNSIKDEKEATKLLELIRLKQKALSRLETLVHRKRLILKHALPVTLKETTTTVSKVPQLKKPRKFSDNKSMTCGKNTTKSTHTMQPIVVEILSCLRNSGSTSWTTESAVNPVSMSISSEGRRSSSTTPSLVPHSMDSEEISIVSSRL